ncbi:MAG: 30S ribosomal protein S12 methylthiotransferase RimO [Lachnospiraceae bacterium]|nr:30S ribosomal protein S12 methylthiotransferase RimO [Lachnospiraceae bacterium]
MKILFISLGCDKNLVDSENMLGLLSEAGYEITDDETTADVIVVNSCCFIGDAKEESINTIIEMGQYKEKGSLKALIVTGCLAQRYAKEIREDLPEVDAVIGTNSYDDIVNAVEEALKHNKFNSLKTLEGLPHDPQKRIVTTGGHFAYLKIAEGCNKNCTYCVIPSVRGRYRSKKLEDLVAEANRLVDNGVKELILVAQETTLYGIDLYGEKSLHKLLDALNEIPGLFWIRILYCYPEEIDQQLIDAIKRNKKVCHYLDMPIQHCNDEILRAMNRKTNKAELIERISHLRKEIPDITLRTTLITGFPGETPEMHEEMMQFVNDMEFDRLGAFPYSPEENTKAFDMPNQLDEDTKQLWKDEIMELEQEVIFDKNESLIGRVMDCFIEGKVADENAYVGRTYRDAPNVDGYIFIQTEDALMTGDIVRAKITGTYEYDLIGELL